MTVGDELRRLMEAAPFAVLGTHGPQGRLDLVPCCFAIDTSGGQPEVVSAVDHKPKRHQRLARLTDIERDPNVTVLVDHRDAVDWSQLWWVRVQGRARVVVAGPDHEAAVAALRRKYPQYRDRPPSGPVIRISADRWTGWSGSGR
jgi:PPOX class probable F420-dependent enzyme